MKRLISALLVMTLAAVFFGAGAAVYAEPLNVAGGGIVKSFPSSSASQNIVNGQPNASNRWLTDVVDDNVWAAIDFGEEFEISSYTVYADKIRRYHLEYWYTDDYTNFASDWAAMPSSSHGADGYWRPVPGSYVTDNGAGYTGGSVSGTPYNKAFTPVTTRAVRFYVDMNVSDPGQPDYDSRVRLWEVEVYHIPGSSEVTPPDNVAAAAVTDIQAKLTWDASPSLGVSGYNVYLDDLDTPVSVLPASAASYVFTGLDPGTGYKLGVSAVMGSNESEITEENITTLTQPSSKNMGLKVLKSTKDSIKISWNAAPGATKYVISRNGIPQGSVTGTEYEDTGIIDTFQKPCLMYSEFEYDVIAVTESNTYKSEALTGKTMRNVAVNSGASYAGGTVYNSYYVRYAFDGDFTTTVNRFISEASAADRWVAIDLNGEFLINEFMIYTDSAGYARSVTAYIGNEQCTGKSDSNMSHWDEVGLLTDLTTHNSNIKLSADRIARYVRVEFGKSHDERLRLFELQVFGTEPQAAEYELSEIAISGGVATFLLIKGDTALPSNTKIIIAEYNAFKRLVAAEVRDIPLTDTPLSVVLNGSTAKVKAFLWDMDTINPICGSKNANIE